MTNKIAIDARPFTGLSNGFTTYLSSVIKPLKEGGFDITLLANKPLLEVHPAIKDLDVKTFGSKNNFQWEQKDLPNYLESAGYDIYFSGANRGIPIRKSPSIKYILGYLDVIPFKFTSYYLFRFPLHFLRQELVPQLIAVARADSLITISKQSSKDIHKLFGRRATPILIKQPEMVKEAAKIKKQFVYVGGVDPRKKIDNLIRAFAEFKKMHNGYKLILIGRGYEVFKRLIAELNLAEDILITGFIKDADKTNYIAESTAMVYPSLYEGYGLAIAESFQLGVPVICGPGGAQKEVGGNAAIYIDPTDPFDICRAMTQIIEVGPRKKFEAKIERQMKLLSSSSIDDQIVKFFSMTGGRK